MKNRGRPKTPTPRSHSVVIYLTETELGCLQSTLIKNKSLSAQLRNRVLGKQPKANDPVNVAERIFMRVGTIRRLCAELCLTIELGSSGESVKSNLYRMTELLLQLQEEIVCRSE